MPHHQTCSFHSLTVRSLPPVSSVPRWLASMHVTLPEDMSRCTMYSKSSLRNVTVVDAVSRQRFGNLITLHLRCGRISCTTYKYDYRNIGISISLVYIVNTRHPLASVFVFLIERHRLTYRLTDRLTDRQRLID